MVMVLERKTRMTNGLFNRREDNGNQRHGFEDSLALDFYFKDLAGATLLTNEEERRLTRAVAACNKQLPIIDNQLQALVISPEYREQLEFDRAVITEAYLGCRNTIIQANLRLVVPVATAYNRRGLPLSDCIEKGNLGLFRAVDKFDYRKGYKFSTYASWWIMAAVTRGIAEDSRVIHLPIDTHAQITRINKLADQSIKLNGVDPTDDDIAGLSLKDGKRKFSPEQVRTVRTYAREPISLSQPTGEDKEGTEEDDVEADGPDLFEITARKILRMEMETLFVAADLSDKEAMVLRWRFGLEDGNTRSLEEVGREMGFSGERARQYEATGLRKLRDHPETDFLRDYLD